MPSLKTVAVAAGLTVILVVGIDATSYAANGKSFLLGKSNTATKITKLKNSAGTPLQLKAKAGYAPLKVSSPVVVTNLNADLLDGKSASDLKGELQNKAYVFNNTTASTTDGSIKYAFTGIAPGTYLLNYSVQMAGATGSTGSPEQAYCTPHVNGSSNTPGFITSVSVGNAMALSASATLSLPAGTTVDVTCGTSNDLSWNNSALFPAQFTFLKLDAVSSGAPTIAKVAKTGIASAKKK
ncbi:MAG: hypothetical protein JWP10_1400 [Nocardioidaceae bacterium]|nr:hypothetical protein [Nocardioidaceae bacterium]